jgi:hypothetical protein
MALVVLAALVAVSGTEEGGMKNVKGEILAVDAEAKAVTVKPSGAAPAEPKELRLTVDDQTKIVKDGRAIELSQLAKGDMVVASYRMASGANVAVNISVQAKDLG